jgi:hypothetical protein
MLGCGLQSIPRAGGWDQMRFGYGLIAAAALAFAAPNVRAEDFCSTCEVQIGLGGTYHWVGWSHGIVAPLVFTFDHDRWELAAFRFTKGQDFYNSTFHWDVHFADPYWAFSFARRLEIFPQKHWTFFVALGASYKTEQDRLSASWWNFNEEIGLRIKPTERWRIELTGRHFSNAGLKLPNHGQDFATLTFSIYPGLFGHAATSN